MKKNLLVPEFKDDQILIVPGNGYLLENESTQGAHK